MAQINQGLDRIAQAASTGTAVSSTTQQSTKLRASSSEKLVNAALSKLKTIFTGWRAAFKTEGEVDRYKQELLISLIEFDVRSQAEIDQGIRRARQEARDGREFMPSCAMFAGWCKDKPKSLPKPKLFLAGPQHPPSQRKRNAEHMKKLREELGL